MNLTKVDFLLNDKVVFLNHGSFGACPKVVFEEYQYWQRELELQPVEFIGRKLPELLKWSREKLSNYICCNPEEVVYITNATEGVNIIARSLKFKKGDEILCTNHEYGACDRTFEFLCNKTEATYKKVEINLPLTTKEDFLKKFFSQVTKNTKLIFVSHITSSTALILPVKEICDKAKELGIHTLIDGAHAPSQIKLNLKEIDPDFYTGNLHKWLCSPKGSAFLYVKKSLQNLIEPLIVSWGWNPIIKGESKFIDELQFTGTRDFASYLSVPKAIDFQKEHNWNIVINDCYNLVCYARKRMSEILNAKIISPESKDWFLQFAAVLLPINIDGKHLKNYLYDEFKIEIPVTDWNKRQLLRISIQVYNTKNDVDILLNALETYMKKI